MPQTVLVVEDEPHIVDSLSFLMKKAGFEVFIARDGDAALRMVKSRPPDLMLLDIMLPRKDGFEVLKSVRSNDAWKDIRVILLTAKGRDVDRLKGMELGADDFVTKPFSTKDVVRLVKQHLGVEEKLA
ncbi:chemotaxis protein CheY [Kiloniella litopenaei]|uniref:Chemotaxis protein CheY n=1 Tax=Kiloniella litopenaei TaxID=1549748 RepID=A0A0M2R3H5_9PROT|nr:response regulator [Kiloniella litopenaei]KKJ76206.1 chemotaxis protein CheY [Kiloniella litopenaei]